MVFVGMVRGLGGSLFSDQISEVHKRVVFQKGGLGGCSPGTKTGTRVHLDVPRDENQNEGTFACSPGTKKPERVYIRQNHPFTKPPLCLLLKIYLGCRMSWPFFSRKPPALT